LIILKIDRLGHILPVKGFAAWYRCLAGSTSEVHGK